MEPHFLFLIQLDAWWYLVHSVGGECTLRVGDRRQTMRQLHVSALLGKVYWADAKGNVMREPKQDVTNNFLGCVLQYFTDPKHGVIHDAEGNEWEVTITQTKNTPAAPNAPPSAPPS